MNINDVSIATISWARDAAEEALLRLALTQLAGLNIPVFISDGGSKADFIQFLNTFPNFTVLIPETKGLWPQAKTSLQAAYAAGSKYILYTEPDKLLFFQNYLPEFLAETPASEETGIVLASRSAAGFQTFPEFQQTTETAINKCCAEIIGPQIDYTYGPFLLNKKIVPYLNLLPTDIGWGWRPFAFGIAHRLNLPLKAIEKDFSCPQDQQQDSPTERIYRMRQLTQNIQGLVLSTNISLQ